MINEIFLRIDTIMRDRGYRNKELNEFLGVNNNTYDNWRTGKSSSYMNHIEKISSFLGVTPGYLITGKLDASSPYTVIEEELIRLFRELTTKKQEAVINLARLLCE